MLKRPATDAATRALTNYADLAHWEYCVRPLSSGHARLGWKCLGAYALYVAVVFLFVFTASGDMAGMLIVFAALPWSLLGSFLFGHAGTVIGTWGGLVLNAICAFFIGYFLSYLMRRSN